MASRFPDIGIDTYHLFDGEGHLADVELSVSDDVFGNRRKEPVVRRSDKHRSSVPFAHVLGRKRVAETEANRVVSVMQIVEFRSF
jgi:hypothetical protein